MTKNSTITGRTEMGQRLFMSFLTPDLGIGVMFAFFHSEGNCSECKFSLNCGYNHVKKPS